MSNDALFHPYKIIHQGRNDLQLQAGNNVKFARLAFLLIPILFLVFGLVLSITQKQIAFLYIIGGVAVLELFLFSFIKIPADLRMDTIGFTLKTVSVKSTKETDYLWNDVDSILQRIIRTKNGTVLAYDAVLATGKKVRFLNFPTYSPKKQSAAEIDSLLSQISNKEVIQKI